MNVTIPLLLIPLPIVLVLSAKDIVSEIEKCSQLVYLNLEGNTLGVEAAEAIGEALQKHPELKKALWKDLFTGRMKTEIPPALKALGCGMIAAGAQLTVLDCSDNALGPNGMVGLVDLIRSKACYSLQELKLNNCGLGITGGKMLAEALLSCIDSSTAAGTPLALRVFVAGRNRLENDGAKALAKVFSKLNTLEEVTMPQNGIYHPGVSALSMAFARNPQMKVLNLNDNTVRAEGAAALADAMLSMPALKEINLGDCLLKTVGGCLLAQAVTDGHLVLETLNLGFNEIGADGGLAVAKAVANKTHLKSLVLDGNQFGGEFRAKIEQELKSSGRFEALTGLEEDDSEGEEDEDEYGEENEEYDEDEDEDYEDIDEEEDEEDEDEDNDGDEETDEDQGVLKQSINRDAPVNLNSSVSFVSSDARPHSVETFLETPNPSLEMFEKIPATDKVAEFTKFLKSLPENDFLVFLSFAILKTSALALKSTEALTVATALYKECIDFAVKTAQVTRIRNFFLLQLGLLKSEDKQFKPLHDVTACRYALESAMRTHEFPEELKNMFQCFLERHQK